VSRFQNWLVRESAWVNHEKWFHGSLFVALTAFVFLVVAPLEFVIRFVCAVLGTGYKLSRRALTKFRP
jgi:hypothetical protein